MSIAPLSIRHLTKRYAAGFAVQDVSLELKAGEIFGLIGVNGAGKTTMIKAVLQLHGMDEGEIRLHGVDARLAESRRDVMYLPEKFAPSPLLTGLEFIRLTLSGYGLKASMAEVDAMAKELTLDPAALRRVVRGFSKGMGQKLGLMAVLLAKRKLLILDEPMSGLDPAARAELRQALMRYREAEKGRTIFFSSHILSDIESMCDRIGVMHGGLLAFTGTAAEFRAKHGRSKDLEAAYMHFLAHASSPATDKKRKA